MTDDQKTVGKSSQIAFFMQVLVVEPGLEGAFFDPRTMCHVSGFKNEGSGNVSVLAFVPFSTDV